MFRIVIGCLLFLVQYSYQNVSPTGSVELDELTFNKVVNKFDVALVKFDVSYPYGDKHDAFLEIAKAARDIDQLLIAEVGVKDYGDRDNEELARKYGATKENFPVVKLFFKDKPEPTTFKSDEGFTEIELKKFVREHTGLYLSSPLSIHEFDILSIKFMEKKDKEERNNYLSVVDEHIAKLDKRDKPIGKMYKIIMKKIIEKGDGFAVTELNRINKLMTSKVSEDKLNELNIKKHILQAFQNDYKREEEYNEEL